MDILTANPFVGLSSLYSVARRVFIMRALLLSRAVEEPDAFDEDFNESESEDEDDEGKEETKLRKHERAAKVQ